MKGSDGMANTDRIREIIHANHGFITSAEAALKGIHRWYLSDMVKHGLLVRVNRGLYATSSEPFLDDDFRFQLQYSHYIYSYQSALYLHGLTDQIPLKREVTAFKGYHPTSSKIDALVHYVKTELYGIGVTEIETAFGNKVKVYDMERTICDLISHRKDIDAEIFIKAVKKYAKSPKKNTMRLYMVAEVFGIEREVYNIFELLS